MRSLSITSRRAIGTIPKVKFTTTAAHMVKPAAEVISEFQQYVNMSPKELEAWLATDKSIGTGVMKPGADESVGHDSGRHILAILKRNPEGNPEGYKDGRLNPGR